MVAERYQRAAVVRLVRGGDEEEKESAAGSNLTAVGQLGASVRVETVVASIATIVRIPFDAVDASDSGDAAVRKCLADCVDSVPFLQVSFVAAVGCDPNLATCSKLSMLTVDACQLRLSKTPRVGPNRRCRRAPGRFCSMRWRPKGVGAAKNAETPKACQR